MAKYFVTKCPYCNKFFESRLGEFEKYTDRVTSHNKCGKFLTTYCEIDTSELKTKIHPELVRRIKNAVINCRNNNAEYLLIAVENALSKQLGKTFVQANIDNILNATKEIAAIINDDNIKSIALSNEDEEST